MGSPDPLDGDLFPDELLRAVQPLPPPGPLAFICVWPARRIASSRVEVDGAAVLRAADAAVSLWSDDPYCSAD